MPIKYNLRQVNPFTVQKNTDIVKNIPIPVYKWDSEKKESYIEKVEEEVTYVTAIQKSTVNGVVNPKIVKFGYCCEPKGILFPIYLKLSGSDDYKEIYTGKNGIIEYGEVSFDSSNGIEKDLSLIINEVLVPKDINFVLDLYTI